jgi:hypothetical protein
MKHPNNLVTFQEHFKSSEREVFIIIIIYVMGGFDSKK